MYCSPREQYGDRIAGSYGPLLHSRPTAFQVALDAGRAALGQGCASLLGYNMVPGRCADGLCMFHA
ncbi:hypothetical protein ACRE_072820 [Hapsidospora chrysogenum ATCC 11550]|uniref:Uncharacterized protein n=1 Tax=Hapsidospora chrysogenum (strain ATCC 11550 / CBS 779.69 / DSM 880 / IAM 14645 / JCM 23072 / IMI 49137) TaxID=857340 RepID=A0A086SXY7_HAPC1|nr:hypothetical protein ACRE_072820 [Hapsidospora chrysogenum ATCC 11550]